MTPTPMDPTLPALLGGCSLGLAVLFLYVAAYAWRDARAKGGPLRWPLHGRYVIFLLLFLLGVSFLNSARLWLEGAHLTWTWFFAFDLWSQTGLRAGLFATLGWFTKRWREGTLLTPPKPPARGATGIRSGP